MVSALEKHPIRDYFKRGLLVSVNTDDPTMFGTSLAQEYELLERECGFSRKEICAFILLGIESSWLPEGRKKSLAREFKMEPSFTETGEHGDAPRH